MSTKGSISYLVLTGFVLTPILGLQTWLQVFPALGVYVANGPYIVMMKATKDIVLCAILILFFLGTLRGRPLLCNPLIVCIGTLLCISFAVTAFEDSPVLALIGLRGLSPLLLVFVAYSYLDMSHIRSVVRVLSFLLLVELCAAWVRARYGLAMHGSTYFGFAARPSGTFASPSGWSLFLCFIVCYLLGFDVHLFGRPRGRTWLLVATSIFLIFLSGSGAGILSLTAVLACYFFFLTRSHPFLKVALLPIFVFVILGIVGSLAVVTGRTGVYGSFGTRVGIFSEVFSSMGPKEMLVGRGLGVASNAAVTVAKLGAFGADATQGVFIADSLYASLMAQTGILFLMAFLLLNLWVFRKALAARYVGINPIVVLAIPAFCFGGLANVSMEVFPVNWLLCIAYGLALKRQETIVSHRHVVPSNAHVPYSLSTVGNL